MSKIKPSKQFMEDFKLCMEYYEVDIDEAKFERDRCLNDMNGAERCYSVVATWVRGLSDERNGSGSV